LSDFSSDFCGSALAGHPAAFADCGPPFADFSMCAIPSFSILAMGSRDGSPEAGMAKRRIAEAKRNGWLIAALWFSGVVLFLVELNSGLAYVQDRFSSVTHSSIGLLPSLAMTLSNLLNTAFWHYRQLQTSFSIIPFVTLPFLLIGLALWMKRKTAWQQQESTEE
jgi:hypothetical protein